MNTETDKIRSRAKQRAQQIQNLQAEAHEPRGEEDLGSPAEDDGEDAVTRLAHEVEHAKQRALAASRLARGTRPR
jgi:hypothetical protein